jgi:cyclopropane-fatty-acyl-phospholipid synthase
MQATTAEPRGASPQAIQQHYDVGNDFYQLWLDDTLSYSCALWNEDETDDALGQAQRRKLDYHIAESRAAGGACVLDVGCGWGAMLDRLVHDHGVGRAVGLTLSAEQAAWIAARRDPRLEIRLENWLDHQPAQPYDAILSIGAFEHFARPEWTDAEKVEAYRAFFTRCHQWLKADGRLSLQTIAYGDLGREEGRQTPGHPFLLQEIFPETDLPTLAELVAASNGLFEIVTLRNDRDHYRRTCRVWFDRLLARRAEATALVGEEVVSRYMRYLKFSATLFHYGQAHLLRLAFRKLHDWRQ